jgi:hypothetical protein
MSDPVFRSLPHRLGQARIQMPIDSADSPAMDPLPELRAFLVLGFPVAKVC